MTDIQKAAAAIADSETLMITAGAGMGVDSGLPDFRGPEGFWRAYPALRGHSFEEMANPAWFHKNPRRAWGFYGHRLNLYRQIKPHQGFDILLKWSQTRDYFIYTANVDGAFQRAGFSSKKIVECHGSIHHLQYVDTHHGRGVWSAKDTRIEVDETTVLASHPLPQQNGYLLRPNILMFGDWGWVGERCNEQESRLRSWLRKVNLETTIVIEMGAGKVVPTTRHFGESLQSAGATLLRINPRDSDGPEGTISIAGGAMDSLRSIDSILGT